MAVDLSNLSPNALAAAMRGGTSGWGNYASADDHVRYAEPILPTTRKRCNCGCKTRQTHMGMANGVALTSGCELYVRRWVRDWLAAISACRS